MLEKSSITNFEEKLKSNYANIFSDLKNQPTWAVKKMESEALVSPTIPFVGKNYNCNKTKVFLYASAENMKDYSGHIDNDNMAINRHRYYFDNDSKDSFFPNVHITPINDGALVIVTAYILNLLKIQYEYNNPRELLENISFANFSKFTIAVEKGEKNDDVAKHPTKLLFSLNYIKKDLEILKPEIIIIPEKIYNRTPNLKKTIKTILPNTLIIPIYQINSGVINRTINKKYPPKNPTDVGILVDWQAKLSNGLTGKTNQNFYSVYTYLEEVIKNLIII